MDYLSKGENSFCENCGIAGVLLSLTCLIQHLVIMADHWIAYALILVYLLSMIGFFLLAKRSYYALLILIVSGSLVFFAEVLMLLSAAYSLVLFLLFVYSAIIVVVMLMNEIQPKIKARAMAHKQEKEKWNSIL